MTNTDIARKIVDRMTEIIDREGYLPWANPWSNEGAKVRVLDGSGRGCRHIRRALSSVRSNAIRARPPVSSAAAFRNAFSSEASTAQTDSTFSPKEELSSSAPSFGAAAVNF